MKEHVPHIAKWKHPVFILHARIMRQLTGKTNYFHLRHGYDLEDRKRHDLWFVTHYHNSHEDDVNASLVERLRFEWYWRKYGSEIHTVTNAVKNKNYSKVPKEVEDYVKKWQPFSAVPPFIVEYIHGMDGQRFHQYQNEHTS